MRAQKRKVLVACALLNQTSQNRGPTHRGLPQNSHAWTPENWRTTARTTSSSISSIHPKNAEPRSKGGAERARAPAMAFTNSTASWLHLPPVSRPPICNGLPQRVPGVFALCLGGLDARQLRWSVLLPRKPCPGLSTGFEGVTSIANCAPWFSGSPQANHDVFLQNPIDNHIRNVRR